MIKTEQKKTWSVFPVNITSGWSFPCAVKTAAKHERSHKIFRHEILITNQICSLLPHIKGIPGCTHEGKAGSV